MHKGNVDLSVTIGKLKLKNPVMPASGTFGYGEEFSQFINLADLGAIIVKGTSLEPRLGSPQHRFVEVAGSAGLFNVGLQNVGVDRFITDKLPYLRQFDTPVIVNAVAYSIEEFVRLADMLSKADGVAGLELNMTCPNVAKGGKQFCADPEVTYQVVKAVRGATDLTIIAKLVPISVDVAVLSKACAEAGADGICPNHSVIGMSIDINTRRSRLGNNLTGALGGPWRKPAAVRAAWLAAQAVDIPVIGVGGITGAEDAIEFFLAGATAVEIGMYNLIDPMTTTKTIDGIMKYVLDKGIRSIDDIRGTFIPPSVEER